MRRRSRISSKSESVINEYLDFLAVQQSKALNPMLDLSGFCAQLQKANL